MTQPQPKPQRPGKTPTGKAQRAEVAERQRLVRRLIVEGLSKSEIVRLLTTGVELAPGAGAIKVSETTARADVDAVALQFLATFTDEDYAAAVIGGALERLIKIAVRAGSGQNPQYHAAIRANLALVQLLSGASPRLRAAFSPSGRVIGEIPAGGAGEGELGTEGEGDDLKRLPMDELRREHRQLRARMNALGLEVHYGRDNGDEG